VICEKDWFRGNIYIDNIYKDMPISTDTLIICAGLIVLIMVAMMFGTSGLVPSYGFEGKQLQSYPYEGFAQAVEYFNEREGEEGFASLNAGEYNEIYSGVRVNGEFATDSSPAMNYGAPKKVTGFDGVQGDSAVENNGMMGYLGPNEARLDCKSYGYTKSTGNVCFSPADLKLLTTRGGNAR
jgi:hypothetical protein